MRITDFNEETVEELKKSYRIGFINSEGKEDETELDASDIYDLAEAYAIFCEDNCIPQDTVTYIEETEQEIEIPDRVYVLISVEDNSIQDPDYFLDKASARRAMKEAFDKVKDIDENAQIHDDYACVQGYYSKYDWRIIDVHMGGEKHE